MGTDYYAILGVQKSANEDELKKGEQSALAHLSLPALAHRYGWIVARTC